MCVVSAWTIATLGCASGMPPCFSGSTNGADGKPGAKRHAARCTCNHTLCSLSSSASVHGTRAAEYLNLPDATICMAGVICASRYLCCFATPIRFLVAEKTCAFSAAKFGETAGLHFPALLVRARMLARTPR